jgi:Tat protein secretion system quality control protein TatD with DNase activity
MAKKEPTNAKKVESIIVEGFKEHKPTLQSFWHKGCIIGENGINTNTKAHARKSQVVYYPRSTRQYYSTSSSKEHGFH